MKALKLAFKDPLNLTSPVPLGNDTAKNCWWKDFEDFQLEPETGRGIKYDHFINIDNDESIEGKPCTGNIDTWVLECNDILVRDLDTRYHAPEIKSYCQNGHRYRDVFRAIDGKCTGYLYSCEKGVFRKKEIPVIEYGDSYHRIANYSGKQVQMIKLVDYAAQGLTEVKEAGCCDCPSR